MRARRPTALLAVFLVALNALWPLVVQARPRTPGVLVPVCTIDGVTHYMELPASKPPAEQRSDSSHEHCKFCVFGVERAVLPTEAPQIVATSGRSIVRTCVESAQPHSSFDSPALPRGPPLSS